ncbi:MAG: hypothetical protein ACP5P3_09410 [Ignavibacteria bacterium]
MKEKELMVVKKVVAHPQINAHIPYKYLISSQTPSIKIAGRLYFKKNIIDNWVIRESPTQTKGICKTFYRKKSKKE